MDTNELLLTTSMSIQQYSASLWEYRSTNSVKFYKHGGRAAFKSLNRLNNDFILTADCEKPLLNIWLLNSQEPYKDPKLVLPGIANCIAICPYCVYLACGIGAKLYVWHLSSGKLLTIQEKHYQSISVIKFSSDSVFLSVGGEDGTLVTYNFSHLVGFQNNFLSQSEAGHVEPLYSKTNHCGKITDMFISNFGGKSRIATISSDHTCFIYKLSTGDVLLDLTFSEELSSVVFNSTGWSIFIGDSSGDIFQINLTEKANLLTSHVDESVIPKFSSHKMSITCLAVNFDSTILASGSEDCKVHIWQMHSREVLKTIDLKGVVTNLQFVLNNEHFFCQNYKPGIVLKKLDRHFDASDQSLDVCISQTTDLEVKEDYLIEDRLESLLKENRYLRATNKQLYDVNVDIVSKKRKVC